ncbi:adenosylmethionine--8-amino-7-oxononanoate transaminase [Corynebacterium tapiri]|uniref:adenosylmethionine--8-amino-7-oxononanoate transaminase n=1 Tax=Corynebacterium tapiri TaxID=1448266 RepID=UPI001FE24D60|nr:adenosylmethionine--8-amino-7-oxononanoate transaminase [Corynebacterium tapiri]
MNTSAIEQFDSAHLWHPYAPAHAGSRVVTSAEGVHITLGSGEKVIDAMSSWWCAIHGHRHPHLMAAAHAQLDILPHVMFGGLTHEPAVRAGDLLLQLTDHAFSSVFFADSGSVSVEVAIKMALQYARATGHPERTKLMTWRSGYHGDTFGAMGVCDPINGMHHLFSGTLAQATFAPAPPVWDAPEEEVAAYLRQCELEVTDDVAAVIIEPVVQGAGGMRFHHPRLVAGIRQLCTRRGILMIADEIATGFGRSGSLFATLDHGVVPDIMCVGKALTGGTMTLAAVMATSEITDGVGTLMHGPTFMANPLACAVAAASLELIQRGDWRTQVAQIEEWLRQGLAGIEGSAAVADVRVLGAIGVIEMREDVDMARATEAAISYGVWLRPFGRLVYTMPPFICTRSDIAAICDAMRAIVAAHE